MTTTEKELLSIEYYQQEITKLVMQNRSSIQVVLFEISSGEFVPFIIHDLNDEKSEILFFENLKDNNQTHIKRVIAMWNNYCIEVPKFSILLKILDLDMQNADDCCVLLNGEKGITSFQLKRIVPDKYIKDV